MAANISAGMTSVGPSDTLGFKLMVLEFSGVTQSSVSPAATFESLATGVDSSGAGDSADSAAGAGGMRLTSGSAGVVSMETFVPPSSGGACARGVDDAMSTVEMPKLDETISLK